MKAKNENLKVAMCCLCVEDFVYDSALRPVAPYCCPDCALGKKPKKRTPAAPQPTLSAS